MSSQLLTGRTIGSTPADMSLSPNCSVSCFHGLQTLRCIYISLASCAVYSLHVQLMLRSKHSAAPAHRTDASSCWSFVSASSTACSPSTKFSKTHFLNSATPALWRRFFFSRILFLFAHSISHAFPPLNRFHPLSFASFIHFAFSLSPPHECFLHSLHAGVQPVALFRHSKLALLASAACCVR